MAMGVGDGPQPILVPTHCVPNAGAPASWGRAPWPFSPIENGQGVGSYEYWCELGQDGKVTAPGHKEV